MNTDSNETAVGIVGKFLKSYAAKPSDVPVVEWLDAEFAGYPEIWRDESERRECSRDVVAGLEGFHEALKRQDSTVAAGGTRESFLRDSIEMGCKAGGVAQVGAYASGIDKAVDEANRLMAEQVFRHNPDGTLDRSSVNLSPTLNGNIAEAHHAGTFGIDNAVKEGNLHAEVPASHGRNSVDILIKDDSGRIVKRYQSKYGADAKATEQQFGNRYRGQTKLAPEGQAEEIPGATDHIEAGGVKSTPLSKEKAVAMQEKVQKTGKAPEYDWNDANANVICRHIGKKAVIAGVLAVGFQGARILGRRIWNGISGKENKPLSEDMKEFAVSAAQSGSAAAGMAAFSGGLVVVAKKGLLGPLVKSVKGNVIANAACAAVENFKIIKMLGSGDINCAEALDLAGRTNCALIGSLAGAAKGAGVGATVGAALGPVGMAIGGFLGGVAGGIAGSVVGEAVYEGAKKACKAACQIATACAKGVYRAVCKVSRVLNPLNWF